MANIVIVICSCGWDAERASIRAANSAFYIHQLTSPDRGDHVSAVQDMRESGTRSPISEFLEGEVGP
jgi:hypothetical protein